MYVMHPRSIIEHAFLYDIVISRRTASHNFGCSKGFFFGGGASAYVYRNVKMIAIKMVSVRFLGAENKLGEGAAAQQAPSLAMRLVVCVIIVTGFLTSTVSI